MTTESIKAKIANNETISQAEVDYLLEADIDALLDYEQAQRIAKLKA